MKTEGTEREKRRKGEKDRERHSVVKPERGWVWVAGKDNMCDYFIEGGV